MAITTSSIRELAWRCEEFLDERAEPLTVSYPGSLALCILDAIFSTGSHPKAVDNVVDRYIARHGRDDGAKSLRYSIAAAGGADAWARAEIHNLKPASTHSGAVLKAEVVDRATRLMADHSIDTVDDLLAAVGDAPSSGRRASEVARGWRELPSQRSGITWRNLLMLAESTHLEIDWRVTSYVAEAAPRFGQVDKDYVLGSIAGAADMLGVEDRVIKRIVWQVTHRRILSKRTRDDLLMHRYANDDFWASGSRFADKYSEAFPGFAETADFGESPDFDEVVFDDSTAEEPEPDVDRSTDWDRLLSLPERMPVPRPVHDEAGPAPF